MITNTIELQIFKCWAENRAGIITKKINGFVIPPVKKIKKPNCPIS